jgi:thioesterase domain-containing protein
MIEVLTPLRLGKKSHPLFMAHGMGGRADEFVHLVGFVRTEQCIYGLQAKGNDGVEPPFERIEELARYYLDAIKRVQPHGPYFLVGFSLGGLVALEMARQISSSGEIVALLAMLESYPHPKQLSLSQRIRLVSRRVKRRALTLLPFPTHFNPRLKSSVHEPDDQIAVRTHTLPVTKRAYESAYTAWKHYQPRLYQGKIHFVKAAVTTIYPDDPFAVWGKLVEEIEVQTVPGDHHGILNTYFGILGSVLSRYLREVPPG